MDQEIIETYEKVIKDIDLYNAGDLSYYCVVKEAVKDIKMLTITYRFNYYVYIMLIKLNILTAKIYKSPSLENEKYHEMISECFELTKAYNYYMLILKEYVKTSLKQKDYKLLSCAYMYSIKVQTILEMINDIFNMINRLDKSLYQEYCLLIPKDFIVSKEQGILEIDNMSEKLQRVNKKANV